MRTRCWSGGGSSQSASASVELLPHAFAPEMRLVAALAAFSSNTPQAVHESHPYPCAADATSHRQVRELTLTLTRRTVPSMLKGSCLCEAVEIEVEDAFLYSCYCHCSRCRRRNGSAFTVFGGIEIDKVRVVAGNELVARLDETENGYYIRCRLCLSPLYAAVRAARYAHVQLGVLTDTPSKGPDHHIMVAHKAPWHVIGDGLPQYAEFKPD